MIAIGFITCAYKRQFTTKRGRAHRIPFEGDFPDTRFYSRHAPLFLSVDAAMKTILAEADRVPVARQIEDIVMSTPLTDIHTHLYDPAFNELLLWGIDDLLTYHYLVAEMFRYVD